LLKQPKNNEETNKTKQQQQQNKYRAEHQPFSASGKGVVNKTTTKQV